jgi:hypothetical protein
MKLGSYEWMAQADTGKFASWLRVGSTSDPLNTTAGDLTAKRFLVGTDATMPTGVDAFISGNLLASGYLGVGQSQLRLYDSDGSNYIGHRANAARTTDLVYEWPATDPTAGQVLTASAPSGGVSTLSWTTPSGGGGGSLNIQQNESTVVASATVLDFRDGDNAGFVTNPSGTTAKVTLEGYALLAGRPGGQTLRGGTAASENLTLQSTANVARGLIKAVDNTVVGGYLNVGSLVAPANTTAGDLTAVRAVIGDDIALPSGTVLQINKNNFVPSGTQFVFYLSGTAAPNNTGSVTVGQQITMAAAPTVSSPTSDVYGLSLQAQHTSGDFALRNLYGLQSNAVKNIASGTAALTNMVSYRAVNRPIAGAVTNMYGVEVVQGAGGDAGNVGTLMGLFIHNGVFGSATTQIGVNIETLTGATTNIGIRNASNLMQLGYARFGALAVPTNTTDGDVTVSRLKVGDGAFGSGVEFSVTGDGALSGFLRVGSETAPTNTTAGDLTTKRLLVGTDTAIPTGVDAFINGNLLASGYLGVGQSQLRLYDSDGSNYIGHRANAARTTDIVYEWPTTDPTAGQVLTASAPSGGVSTLSWTTPSGGGGGGSLTIQQNESTVVAAATVLDFRDGDNTGFVTNPAGTTAKVTLEGYALLAGRPGGQTLRGGTAANENLTLQSTANVTRGLIKAVDNTVVGGYLNVGSLVAPTNTTAGDLTAVRLRMPDGAFQTAGTVFELTPADTAGATDTNVMRVLAAKNSSAGANSDVRGLEFTMQDKSASGTQRTLAGIKVLVWHTGAGTLTNGRAFEAALQNDAGTVTNLDAFTVTRNTLAGTVTQIRGLAIPNLGAAAVGSAIGIDITAQSGATTLNVGIRNADGRYLNSNVAKPANPPAGQSYLYSRLNADLAGATNFKTFWGLDENGFESAMSLRARTIYPLPVLRASATASTALPANNTSAFVSHAMIPFPIRVNKILYNVSAAGNAANVIRIAIYSENGTQKYVDVTDAVGAATGVRTIDITDITFAPGNYLFFICHSAFSTTASSVTTYTCDTIATTHIAGEPDLGGTLTIVGGAAPATIDPTALTTVAPSNKMPVIRLLGTTLGA